MNSGIGLKTRLKTIDGPLVLNRLIASQKKTLTKDGTYRIDFIAPLVLFDEHNKEVEVKRLYVLPKAKCNVIVLASTVTVMVGADTGFKMLNGLWSKARKVMAMDALQAYTCSCGAIGGLAITSTEEAEGEIAHLEVGSFQLANGGIVRTRCRGGVNKDTEPFIAKLINNMEPLPPGYSKLVDDNFEDLL